MGTLFEIDHSTGVVDFKKNGTTNLVVEKGNAFPGTPTDGHLFYRTDLTQFFVYDNGLTDWKTQAGGSLRIYNETPSGTVDGVNTVFTVVNQYVAGTTIVTRNGLVMKPGDDYTETTPSTGTITFAVAPTGGSIILVSYSRTIGQDVPKLLKFTVETGTPSGTYTGSTTVFDLPFSYTPGTGSLLVFSGGVIMAVGGSADYVETDNNTVTFNSARTGGEVVQFLKLGVANDLGNTGGWVETAGAVTVETLTNQVRIGDGSVATPSLVFANDLDTGFSRPNVNKINLNAGGVVGLQVDGTVANEYIYSSFRHSFADGTTALPSISFTSDQDKGFYSRDASSVGYSNASREAVIFTGAGQDGINSVGAFNINTGVPSTGNTARLTAQTGTGDGDAYLSITANGSSFHFGKDVSDSGAIVFGTTSSVGNNPIFRIDATTRQFQTNDGTAATPQYSFISDPDTGVYRSASNAIGFSTNGVSKLTIGNTSAATASFNDNLVSVPWLFSLSQDNSTSMEISNTSTGASAGTGIVLRGGGGGASIRYNSPNSVGTLSSGLPAADMIEFTNAAAGVAGIEINTGTTATANGIVFGVGAQVIGSNTVLTLDESKNATFTGRVRAADGTSGSPAYSFSNDSNTGLFRSGTDQFDASCNGATVFRFGDSANGNRSSHDLIPDATDAGALGRSTNRWSVVHATNGTIQTSHSSTKEVLGDIPDDAEIPRGIFFRRPGEDRIRVGFLADNLPQEAFFEDGVSIETSAPIGVLCVKLKQAFREIENLKNEVRILKGE